MRNVAVSALARGSWIIGCAPPSSKTNQAVDLQPNKPALSPRRCPGWYDAGRWPGTGKLSAEPSRHYFSRTGPPSDILWHFSAGAARRRNSHWCCMRRLDRRTAASRSNRHRRPRRRTRRASSRACPNRNLDIWSPSSRSTGPGSRCPFRTSGNGIRKSA